MDLGICPDRVPGCHYGGHWQALWIFVPHSILQDQSAGLPINGCQYGVFCVKRIQLVKKDIEGFTRAIAYLVFVAVDCPGFSQVG